MAARRAGPRPHAGAHGAPQTASFAEVNHYVGACLAGALLPPTVGMRKGAVTATQARIYDVRSRIQVSLAGLAALPFGGREREREREGCSALWWGGAFTSHRVRPYTAHGRVRLRDTQPALARRRSPTCCTPPLDCDGCLRACS